MNDGDGGKVNNDPVTSTAGAEKLIGDALLEIAGRSIDSDEAGIGSKSADTEVDR